MAGKTPSLFWRLTTAISLGLLLGAGILAYAAYNYAHTAADDAYDRLLLGAASQIGETIRVEDQAITTDIPVSAFETLSVSRQERVYYRVVGPDGHPDKDAVLFNLRDGRIAMIHRLHPDMQLAVFGSLEELYEAGAGYWDEHLNGLDRHTVIRPSPGSLGVGAGAPPVVTEAGLLLFYHERDSELQYTIKVALLNDETGHVESLLPEPILRPELPWERKGDVDDVVFVQGAARLPDGTIYLTYGAADRCIGAASVEAAELVDALRAAA